MTDERTRILSMLKDGKVSVEEAQELLDALGKKNEIVKADNAADVPKKNFKYLRVLVEGSGPKKEKVNVKIPLALIRAGVKMQSILPRKARDKLNFSFREKEVNFNLDDLNAENIEEFIQALGDMSIDVEEEHEKVRIFCE